MEITTVPAKVISGVNIQLSLEEAYELRKLIAPLPCVGIVYPLYRELCRALNGPRV